MLKSVIAVALAGLFLATPVAAMAAPRHAMHPRMHQMMVMVNGRMAPLYVMVDGKLTPVLIGESANGS